MGYILHITATALIILWLIGFFALSAGPLIHLILLFAVVSILSLYVRSRRQYFESRNQKS